MFNIVSKRKIFNYFKEKDKEKNCSKINLLKAKEDLGVSRGKIIKAVNHYKKKGLLEYYPANKTDVPEEVMQDFVCVLPKEKKKAKIPTPVIGVSVAVIGGIILYILEYLLKPMLECLIKHLYGWRKNAVLS